MCVYNVSVCFPLNYTTRFWYGKQTLIPLITRKVSNSQTMPISRVTLLPSSLPSPLSVLKPQQKKVALTSHHHVHDPPSFLPLPTTSHETRGQSTPTQLDAERAPRDHMTVPPSVLNVGPQLFHRPPNQHPLVSLDIIRFNTQAFIG